MNNLHLKAVKIARMLFCSVLLISCRNITPASMETKTPILSPTLSLHTTSDNIDTDVYDENISFEIKSEDSLCRKSNEPFQINLSFTNLTNNTLNLADQFNVAKGRNGAGGNLIPQITLDGREIYTIWDNSGVDFPLPSVDNYLKIPPYEVFNKLIDFYFPEELLESWPANPEVVVTPSLGNYILGFSFYHVDQSTQNWSGLLKSNPIDICLK